MADIKITEMTADDAMESLGMTQPKKRRAKTPAPPPPPPPPPSPVTTKTEEEEPPKKVFNIASTFDYDAVVQELQKQEAARNQRTTEPVQWKQILLMGAGLFIFGWGVCKLARSIFSTAPSIELTAEQIAENLTPEQIGQILKGQ